MSEFRSVKRNVHKESIFTDSRANPHTITNMYCAECDHLLTETHHDLVTQKIKTLYIDELYRLLRTKEGRKELLHQLINHVAHGAELSHAVKDTINAINECEVDAKSLWEMAEDK